MNGEIIAIGRELLMGEIVDTNSSFIAQMLVRSGVTVEHISQVGDDIEHLCEALERALERANVVVTCGGLGPTSDDLTREAAARVMNEDLSVDASLLSWLEGVFRERGFENMPKTNIKQAWLIPSAEPIANALGTAPGWWVTKNDRHLILTPGPPRELQRMWRDGIASRLERISGGEKLAVCTLKTAGLTEGNMDEIVSDLFGRENPYLGIYARTDGIHLRIIGRSASMENAEAMVKDMESEIEARLTGYIWGKNEETPGLVASQLMAENKTTLAVLEAGSGGAVSAMFVESEAGEWFKGSLVIDEYADLSSVSLEALLGWNGKSIADAKTALNMAHAARRMMKADIGLGVGPVAKDIREGTPEGTVHVGMVVG